MTEERRGGKGGKLMIFDRNPLKESIKNVIMNTRCRDLNLIDPTLVNAKLSNLLSLVIRHF